MRTRFLATFLVIVTACGGDDGVNHLADAPPVPLDAPADSAIDSPDAPDPLITLTTTLAGSGVGTVTSAPAGISCASGSCSADFDPHAMVSLTAAPGTGSVFVGWGGACSGTTQMWPRTPEIAATNSNVVSNPRGRDRNMAERIHHHCER